MRRDISQSLLQWKANAHRKPLLLMGARQVGKTHALHELGRTYSNYVYLNFEDTPSLCELFSNRLDPHEMIKIISVEKKTNIQPHNTLIIFDEIQACPNALVSLKYFCENASEYPVCAAGSLLGVTLMHTQGFPVGKVNFLHLYPLCFSEFLDALNESELKIIFKQSKK